MLKSCVSILLKQGLIKFENVNILIGQSSNVMAPLTSSVARIHFKDIMEAAKIAVCFGMQIQQSKVDGSEVNAQGVYITSPLRNNKVNNSSNSDSMVYNNISTTNIYDIDTLAKGGWILLEALIGQDILTSNTLKYDQTSAEFVVKSFIYKQQQKKKILLNTATCNPNNTSYINGYAILDEDDVRMLQVLDKLLEFIPLSYIKLIKAELVPLLLSMTLSSDAITASIAAMYTISKICMLKQSNNDDENDQSADKVVATSKSKRVVVISTQQTSNKTIGSKVNNNVQSQNNDDEEEDDNEDNNNNDEDSESGSNNSDDDSSDDDGDEDYGRSKSKARYKKPTLMKKNTSNKSSNSTLTTNTSKKRISTKSNTEYNNDDSLYTQKTIAPELTTTQLCEWFDDVQLWSGKLLATANIILETYVQNKSIVVPSSVANSNNNTNKSQNNNSISNSMFVSSGIEGLPPAQITPYMLQTMNISSKYILIYIIIYQI